MRWVPITILASLLVATRGAPMVYSCPQSHIAQCESEFITCSEKRQSRQDRETNCVCWTNAYACFRDCNAFPSGWLDRCLEECDTVHCEPPEFDLNAASAHPQASLKALVVGLAVLAATTTV